MDKISYHELIEKLPPVNNEVQLYQIRKELEKTGKSIVVLDDDPTGTQTVHDVPVLTSWEREILLEELNNKPVVFYILTNSRSLPETEAIYLNREICENLKWASEKSGRELIIMSRSDSTLRGHYPVETEIIRNVFGLNDAATVLIPAFFEGGRHTINNVHYVREGDIFIPAAQTPFAQDKAFGYKNSDLQLWVQEKHKGQKNTKDIISISIEQIRDQGKNEVYNILSSAKPGQVIVVNAFNYEDLEVVAHSLLKAHNNGKSFIYRTAASIIPVMAGIQIKPVLNTFPQNTRGKGLIVLGSYVPKSSQQLEHLIKNTDISSVKVEVEKLLIKEKRELYLEEIIKELNNTLKDSHVVLYTSRELIHGENAIESLNIGNLVSESLVYIVKSICSRPSYIIGKGGITSSDLATKALNIKRAKVKGQILPGIPVWELGKETKFPGMYYIVFPGNVGTAESLTLATKKINDY